MPEDEKAQHAAAVIEYHRERVGCCSCGWYGDRYSTPGPAQVQVDRHVNSPGKASS